ncbi:hypothetical protein G9A89_005680, partial [Geosiphon pyriformis]
FYKSYSKLLKIPLAARNKTNAVNKPSKARVPVTFPYDDDDVFVEFDEVELLLLVVLVLAAPDGEASLVLLLEDDEADSVPDGDALLEDLLEVLVVTGVAACLESLAVPDVWVEFAFEVELETAAEVVAGGSAANTPIVNKKMHRAKTAVNFIFNMVF